MFTKVVITFHIRKPNSLPGKGKPLKCKSKVCQRLRRKVNVAVSLLSETTGCTRRYPKCTLQSNRSLPSCQCPPHRLLTANTSRADGRHQYKMLLMQEVCLKWFARNPLGYASSSLIRCMGRLNLDGFEKLLSSVIQRGNDV